MKIPVLTDLQGEVNRLFIAGAKFATNDPKIAKHLPALTKLGERAPAIKKLAEMTQELLTGNEPDVALADLGIYLNSILSTQGDTTNQDMEEIKHQPLIKELPYSTAPYSTLTPIIAALSKPGSNRYEVIENAFKEEQFNDFRLYPYIAKGLEDKYAPLIDFLFEKVIPSLGSAMIPFLLRDLDLQGSKTNVKRLTLLDNLNYEKIASLAEYAIKAGNEHIQLAAIPILGKNKENENLLLALANERRSAIKDMALVGLVILDSDAGKDKMIKLLSSVNFKPAIAAAAKCNDPLYNLKIFKIIKKRYDELVETDIKNIDQFADILLALRNKSDAYVLEFLVEIFKENKVKKSYGGYLMATNTVIRSLPLDYSLYIYERIAYTEVFKENHRYYKGYSGHSEYASDNLVTSYFEVAQARYSPERMYNVFEPFYSTNVYFNSLYNKEKKDIRWLAPFTKKQDITGVISLLNTEARDDALDYLKVHMRTKKIPALFMRDYFKKLSSYLTPAEVEEFRKEIKK
ncbi:MAG: DUF1104 domain-containing protein [Defluviitaleaceae bacterium]|nr:DUF1104 domain-containing protein [Defluviitaleaceae bacterium]